MIMIISKDENIKYAAGFIKGMRNKFLNTATKM